MKSILARCMSLLLLLAAANAFTIPQPDGYLNDRANIINEQDEQTLEQMITQFEQNTSDEIAILTLPTLSGENIDMLGTQIAEQRGVGEDEEDNGILILIAPKERERRIDVGYGLEGTIPDAIAYRLGSQILPNYFRQEKYGAGLIELNTRLIAILEGREDIPQDLEQPQNQDDNWLTYIIIMTVITMILSSQLRRYLEKKTHKTATAITGIGVTTGLGIVLFGSSLLAVFLIWFSIWRLLGLFGEQGGSTLGLGPTRYGGRSSGGSSFGGFGGFGGGSFGGGGASGGR